MILSNFFFRCVVGDNDDDDNDTQMAPFPSNYYVSHWDNCVLVFAFYFSHHQMIYVRWNVFRILYSIFFISLPRKKGNVLIALLKMELSVIIINPKKKETHVFDCAVDNFIKCFLLAAWQLETDTLYHLFNDAIYRFRIVGVNYG